MTPLDFSVVLAAFGGVSAASIVFYTYPRRRLITRLGFGVLSAVFWVLDYPIAYLTPFTLTLFSLYMVESFAWRVDPH